MGYYTPLISGDIFNTIFCARMTILMVKGMVMFIVWFKSVTSKNQAHFAGFFVVSKRDPGLLWLSIFPGL